jgi:hypothetical protein
VTLGKAGQGTGQPLPPAAAADLVTAAGLQYLDVHQHWRVTSWHGTPVVVFDDERAVLTVLWEATQLGWLRQAPALIRLDAHHDQWPLADEAQRAWCAAVRAGSRRGVFASVEFDVGCDDADWVRAAAVAGLVAEVVTFYVTERPGPAPLPGVRSVSLGGLGTELDPGGRLAAGPAAADRQVPGWDPVACRFGAGGRPYVLSIDLDAFTLAGEDGHPQAWPRERLVAELATPRRRPGGTVRAADVLRALAQDATVVTIAREPVYCGGDLAAAGLLGTLDEQVFGGALGGE